VNDQAKYLHGAGAREQRRLEAQAELLGGERFLPALSSGMRLIDVGCGTGAIARRVAVRVSPTPVVGLDTEPDQLEAAGRASSARLRLVRGRAEELPFAHAAFDGAYCRFLLEHLTDPSRAIREMKRVVRDNGWICALEWEPDALVMYPPCPAVLGLWQAIYAFQASTGVDPRIGRRLYALFCDAGLREVRADTLTWSATAAAPDTAATYVEGAREIIRQTRTSLIEGNYVTPGQIDRALSEYDAFLASAGSFVSHVFCRATAVV
jgi:SAM-dependent methyltransferase